MSTVPLNIYTFLSNTGFTRRNTLFIFLWLRPRNTCIYSTRRLDTQGHTPHKNHSSRRKLKLSWTARVGVGIHKIDIYPVCIVGM